jgi:branched-chain amino acid aminotransferase
MDVYYVDGEFVPADEATIPVNDLAVLRGYGVFDSLRTYGGKPFYLREHIERLERSARKIGLDFIWSQKALADIVMQTLARNNHAEYNIRIVLTGGVSNDFITPQGKPRLLVMVTQRKQLPDWWYTDGVKIITEPYERDNPGAKSLDYIAGVMALRKANRENAIEVIYTDGAGLVREGTTSNIFVFQGDTLLTPGNAILLGITRQVVLDLTGGIYETEVRDLKLEDLKAADEVFITASNKEVVPVIQVNDTVIGSGKPGARTRKVMEIFSEYTRKSATG